MTKTVVFDVDGTLVDTRDLSIEAYHAVGVKPPADSWMSPWREWLTRYFAGDRRRAEATYRRKTKIYEQMLANCDITFYWMVPALVARELCHGTYGNVDIHILTGGAQVTTDVILRKLDIHPKVVRCGLNYADRAAFLADVPPGTLYLDNHPGTVSQLLVELPTVRSVLFDGQTFEQLMAEALYEPRRVTA